ncbi:hypothetical protein [Carboxylicivirga sp. N1Y90]|uniref:hypothetical protein n=1 Tax=Carboxylicivirga fragile TaxID=3417571 RepID=UPI003D33C3DB|nr:hypothetical protein [Marinilabiliaceae bacterium N1Y90]
MIEPIYSEFDLSPVINVLNEQIHEIEFRLINNDTDRKASREKLRGRIEGIKRGIGEVKRFAQNTSHFLN